MAFPAAILAIVEAVNTASAVSKPILAAKDNARFFGSVKLTVERAGHVGGGTVYGANLPTVGSSTGSYTRFKGSDGATGKTVFTSDQAYVAWSNHNWILLQNGVVIDNGAGAGKFQISNVGGFAVVTLGTGAGDNDTIELHKVTPVAVLTFADATTQFKKAEGIGYEVMWYVADATTTPSSTNVYIEANRS